MAYSFRTLSALGAFLVAPLLTSACIDKEVPVGSLLGAGGGIPQPIVGGAGGEAGETGSGGAGVPQLDQSGPLYGESGTAPDELRLNFQTIDVPEASSATDIAFLPDEDGDVTTLSILHLDRRNNVRLVDLQDGTATVRRSWNVDEEGYTGEACPTTNVLLDPDFESNHFIYLTKCTDDVTVTQLLRYEFSEDEGPRNEALIFETSDASATDGWHRFGTIGFEPDGTLWMLVGDHEADGEPAQDTASPLGALVRLVPNRDPDGDGYTSASGNWAEVSDDDAVEPLIYAYGLRSPWRGTMDSQGRHWFADVGNNSVEEVNLVSEAGQNFGWEVLEGPCEDDCDGLTDPLLHYEHGDDPNVADEPGAGGSNQRAIWMGQIYEGATYDRYEGLMDGVVPYGDLFVGYVRGAKANAANELTMDAPIGLLFSVTSWKVGPDGYAYALDLYGDLHVALLAYE